MRSVNNLKLLIAAVLLLHDLGHLGALAGTVYHRVRDDRHLTEGSAP